MKSSTARILEQIDLEAVQQAVHSVVLPEWEYSSIAERIIHATDIFLEEDLKTAKTLLIEHEFDNVVRGIFDLVHVNHNDKCKIIDWKTTGDVKKPNYGDTLRSEFQSSFYLSFGGEDLVSRMGLPVPEYLEYRCVDEKEVWRTKDKQDYLAAPANVATFTVLNGDIQRQDALAQIDAIDFMYETQMTLPVWTRNRPKACFTGYEKGPTCPFFEDCTHMTMPGMTEEDSQRLWDKRPRSKSAIKDFLDCPEKFRRLRILNEKENIQKPLPILKGESFHAGIASIYQQTWILKQEGKLIL